MKLLSCVRLFATPWTVAHQALPSMGFSRQEYWSGLPFPSPSSYRRWRRWLWAGPQNQKVRLVVRRFEHALELPGGLIRILNAGPQPQNFWFWGLGWSHRICMSNKLSGDGDTLGPHYQPELSGKESNSKHRAWSVERKIKHH